MRETPLEYTDIVFNAKPDAVPYNYRISYKVTQLCLIMRICGRGDKASHDFICLNFSGEHEKAC
jgi:hypothetical protein